MNVLVVTVGYPTQREPVNGIYVRELALAAAQRANVAVLHLARGEPWGLRRVPDEPLPTWRSGFARRPAAPGLLGAAALALRRLPAPDVVHAHFFPAAAAAGLFTRRPIVLSEHWSVFLPEDPLTLGPGLRAAARFAFRRAAIVLPVSEALRRGMEAEGLHADFEVVPNVVDTGLFHRGEGPRNGRLLAVGLLYEAKGYEYLLEALALLRANGSADLELDVVGDGPERARYEALAARLGLGDAVVFHGTLPKPEVARMMREASLFVLASRYENNPVAVIESLASGLPVVATAVGGVPELVDETNGVLARPRDVPSLAEAIAGAMASLERYDRAALARAARARFGRDAIAARLGATYEKVLTTQ